MGCCCSSNEEETEEGENRRKNQSDLYCAGDDCHCMDDWCNIFMCCFICKNTENGCCVGCNSDCCDSGGGTDAVAGGVAGDVDMGDADCDCDCDCFS